MGEKKPKLGGGFILLRPEDDALLALIREDGLYDLPKGRAEPSETYLQAAIRECFEECSILVDEQEVLNIGPFTNGSLVLYVAETEGIPQILPHKKTGILEHAGYKWVDVDQFCDNTLEYLIPLLREADLEIEKLKHYTSST